MAEAIVDQITTCLVSPTSTYPSTQVMNYVDTPNSNLMCCICHAPFIDPTTTKACMHTFCRDCIVEAVKHAPQCPIDRFPLSPDDLVPANPIVKHLVDELIVECSQRELGCEHTCQRQLLASHLKDGCQYVTVTCSKEGCEEIILRKDIDKHAEDCGRRMTQCDGCGVTVRVGELDVRIHTSSCIIANTGTVTQKHNDECPCKTFTCPNCLSELPRSESRTHESTSCPDALVSCEHASFGCAWTGTRRTLADVHRPSCAYESIKGFLMHSAERQGALAAENALLRERVSALDGLTQAMRRELHALKASLGPWYRPGGGDLLQNEASTSSTNSTWSRPTVTPSSPPASTSSGAAFSDPRLSLAAPEPFDAVYSTSTVPYEHEDPLASYFPPSEDSAPLTPASAPAYATTHTRSYSHSHSHSQSSTTPAHHAHAHQSHPHPHAHQSHPHPHAHQSHPHPHAHAHTLPPAATPVAPLNLSTSLEGTLAGLRESVAAVGATVDSLARRTDIALTHEAMRVGEDVASLRYAVQGIRVQLHRMMMDRNAQVTGRMGEPGTGMGLGVGAGVIHPPMLSPQFPGPSPGTKL
ncbi:hypothetical protein CONPUDRAFT_151921 [Coniophora puteana RWD-64-598 SS2]|uniref:RING-type domain-containing protein n=1 Tax=Coniophora puteana (strain RWD-64-598) TaxID=741705 RepID=A0A5M3MUR9_CONPW|nr:uncharacterized protein CONPUDRAFT_151921 [Coniophora puteana RWD-64-598 SS2]EIW82863.1 hypothetical protein CONPUDRAFT_151921 [Coniophora puteana RWD-64-598 SS2]